MSNAWVKQNSQPKKPSSNGSADVMKDILRPDLAGSNVMDAILRAPPPGPPAPSALPPPEKPKPERAAFVAPELQKTAYQKVSLDRSGIDQGFDAARQKVQNVENRNLQGQRDALARRAAQLGNAPGGALIKAEQMAGDASAERLGGMNMEIEAAKAAELRRLGETELQLNLQREEAQAARDLAKWQTDTNTAMQEYGMELDQSRFDETLELQKKAAALSEKAQAFQQTYAGKQLDLAWKQFDHEKFVDSFNMKLANKMAGQKDPLEQLFGYFSMSNFSGGGGDGGSIPW